MTTSAEIRQLAEAGAAEAQRAVFLPSSVLASRQGVDSLAREVTALANRDGGRVVLGVSAAGKFEENASLDPEAADAAIAEALTSRISPPVDATVEHIVAEAGEAIVVRMLPRCGPPYRAPAPDGSGVPTVFVRIGDRTRAASAEQVEWMERVQRDPAVELDWTLATTAGPEAPGAPAAPIASRYRQMLSRAPEALAQEISSGAEERARVCAELAPWALLLDLDAALEEDPGAERISLDELAQPGPRSTIGALPGGVGALLGEVADTGLLSRLLRARPARPVFRVPHGVEPHVDLLHHQRKGRVMLVHPTWVVTFAATPAAGVDAQGKLRLELSCSLAFPEREGQIEAQRDARRVVAQISDRWLAPSA